MKILHTSDLHLGITLCSEKITVYQEKLPEILCNAVKENNIDCVIIAGDIFDTSLSSAESIGIWNDIVTRLCLEMKTPVIVCSGNHDGSARLSSCSELLKATGLYIFGRLTSDIKPVSIGNTDIYVLPYFNPSEVNPLFRTEKDENPYKTVLDKIYSEMDINKTNILVAHCFVAGAETSESDSSAMATIAVGGADIVPAHYFDKFDYVALGHLHRPQTIGNSNCLIRYCGTPFKYSFSECSHKKSFSVFDTETKELSEVSVPEIYKLREIKDTYKNIVKNAQLDNSRNDYMKIIMTDSYKGEINNNQIKELYPNTLILQGLSFRDNFTAEFTADEISSLDIITLAKKYCESAKGTPPDEDELYWLDEALKKCEEEEMQ